jgi:hypothetical protein
MSTLFSTGAGDAQTAAELDGRPGQYLTDGANLYLLLDTVHGGLGEMISLEDCRSLEVMLLPVGVLHALREVIRDGDDENSPYSL